MTEPRWTVDEACEDRSDVLLSYEPEMQVVIASVSADPSIVADARIRADAFAQLVAAVRDADTLRQAVRDADTLRQASAFAAEIREHIGEHIHEFSILRLLDLLAPPAPDTGAEP